MVDSLFRICFFSSYGIVVLGDLVRAAMGLVVILKEERHGNEVREEDTISVKVELFRRGELSRTIVTELFFIRSFTLNYVNKNKNKNLTIDY